MHGDFSLHAGDASAGCRLSGMRAREIAAIPGNDRKAEIPGRLPQDGPGPSAIPGTGLSGFSGEGAGSSRSWPSMDGFRRAGRSHHDSGE